MSNCLLIKNCMLTTFFNDGYNATKILENVDLELRRGEIYGLAGISGRGQRELMETLFGLRASGGGSITLSGNDVTRAGIDKRLGLGMAFISEDPLRDNVVPGMSILEHMALSGAPVKSKGFRIDWKAMREALDREKVMRELGCRRCPGSWKPCRAETCSARCWPGPLSNPPRCCWPAIPLGDWTSAP